MVASGAAVVFDRPGAMFALGGGALLLLFIGLHNPWDMTAYHVLSPGQRSPKRG